MAVLTRGNAVVLWTALAVVAFGCVRLSAAGKFDDPWADRPADQTRAESGVAPAETTPAAQVDLQLIGFYQKRLSQGSLRPTCRFTPSCSQYGKLAIQRYGAAKGMLMTAERLLRCNRSGVAGYYADYPTSQGRIIDPPQNNYFFQ